MEKDKPAEAIRTFSRLEKHLAARPAQLRAARKNGVKLVGYLPGGYLPEELIHAAGAVPLGLIHGGRQQPAEAGLAMVPRIICPFARAQLGESASGENPYYSVLDMLVAPVTCQHLKKITEVWEHQDKVEIFKLGVPHQYGNEYEVQYYADRLKALRDQLEALTGNKITDEKIRQAIGLYNKIRSLLKQISFLRRADSPAVNAADFARLNHASFYADPSVMVEILESFLEEIGDRRTVAAGKPRLLLIGPNLGYGDDRILKLVADAGGEIVIEEICEGIRYYWHGIEDGKDTFQALVKGYLLDRVPCAFMRDSARKRLAFVLDLIKDFRVSGVIWYQLLCCETYDTESYFFAERLRELGIPMLILESDYGTADTGQMKTRIEAFMEIILGAAFQ